MDREINKIIHRLGLKKLEVEGGFFKETYRSEQKLENSKNIATAIYYLLTNKDFSRLHKLPSDEIYHFYLGDAVEMLNLYEDGTSDIIILGNDILQEQKPQILVPKNTWQASRLKKGGTFALMGTTMSPGFDHSDYSDAKDYLQEILDRYPDRSRLIKFFVDQ
jgi:uncharacterized protein